MPPKNTTITKLLSTQSASIRTLTSVGAHMTLAGSFLVETLWTMFTLELILWGMDCHVSLKAAAGMEYFATDLTGPGEWGIMGKFVVLKAGGEVECHSTFITHIWLTSKMDIFMLLKTPLLSECFATIIAQKVLHVQVHCVHMQLHGIDCAKVFVAYRTWNWLLHIARLMDTLMVVKGVGTFVLLSTFITLECICMWRQMTL